MSVLLGHMKAFRALSTAFREMAANLGQDTVCDARAAAPYFHVMADVYWDAAARLEQQMREESSRPVREEEWLPEGIGDGA